MDLVLFFAHDQNKVEENSINSWTELVTVEKVVSSVGCSVFAEGFELFVYLVNGLKKNLFDELWLFEESIVTA